MPILAIFVKKYYFGSKLIYRHIWTNVHNTRREITLGHLSMDAWFMSFVIPKKHECVAKVNLYTV